MLPDGPVECGDGVEQRQIYTTNDFSFAAYLIAIHNFKLMQAKKTGRTYRFNLFHESGNIDVEKLKLAFMGSEIQKFDHTVRDLKRILFSDNSS